MRFLITTMPIPGHVQPMLPIAGKLLERGHEVAWYTGSGHRAQVEAAGARYLPMRAAPDFDLTDERVLPERHRLRGLAQLKLYIKRLFLDSVPGQMIDLRHHAAAFPPDAYLSDLTFLGALFLCELGGPPCALLGATPVPLSSRDTAPYGLAMAPRGTVLARWRNGVLNWLFGRVIFHDVNVDANRLRESIGLPPASYPFLDTAKTVSSLYLQATTEAFEYPRRDLPPQFHYIGPLLPAARDFRRPAWWHELDQPAAAGPPPTLRTGLARRPVVHVTQGTIATDPAQLLVPAIRALADQPVLVVVTTARAVDSFPLKALPANVRLESFVPYADLLPKVDVMVTNAGYGGVQLALAHGVPLVAAGRSEDKAEVAARIAWSGTGIALPELASVAQRTAAIRTAVRRVLTDPTYRLNAQRVRDDFARHDAPNEAVWRLEQLVAADRRQRAAAGAAVPAGAPTAAIPVVPPAAARAATPATTPAARQRPPEAVARH
jgi:UDP:flavonoid glycosyltransferase YjiC (YdhE family)